MSRRYPSYMTSRLRERYLPSPDDLLADERQQRADRARQQAADDAARAAGRYVPTTTARLTAAAAELTLTMAGVAGRLEPVRDTPEGGTVLRYDGPATLAELADALPAHACAVTDDGTRWVRTGPWPN